MSENDEVVVGTGPAFDRELPKAGSCAARVWRVFNVGLQPGFKGGEPKPNVVIYFLLPYKYTAGDYKGKRMLLNQKYVAGMGKFETVAAKRTYLRRDTEAILGRPLTKEECAGMRLRSNLEGVACMLNIMHENGYANIKGIMSMPEGMPPLQQEPEADPTPDYIPKYIVKLREQAIVQERADTDKIADKGWGQASPTPAREPTAEEKEMF